MVNKKLVTQEVSDIEAMCGNRELERKKTQIVLWKVIILWHI